MGGLASGIMRGGEGDDFVSGGKGDDVVPGSQGDDWVLGGFGNDTLRGADGEDWLTGGAGDDLFRVDFRYSNGFQDDPDGLTMMQADDFLTDFRHGQDKLQITYYDEGPEHPEPGQGPVNLTVAFAQLHTTGDGVLNNADAGFEAKSLEFDGFRLPSLVIDVSQFTFDTPYVAGGTITLFGVNQLTAADFDTLTLQPSPYG